MSVTLQRDALVTLAKAVDGVGVVHSFERYSNDSTVYKEWFTRAGEVNGWQVLAKEMAPTVHSCEEVEHHTRFELRGYVSVVDADESRKTAEDLVRTILNTLIAARTLTGTATHTHSHDADDIVQVMAKIGEGERLCHLIRIRFIADEVLAVSYS